MATDTYERRKAAGLCVRCGENQPITKVLCAGCKDKFREAQCRSQNRLAAERRASGICCGCGKRKAKTGRTRCKQCIEKSRRRGNNRVVRCKTLSQCIACNKTLDRKGIHCIECSIKRRKYEVTKKLRRETRKVCVGCGRPRDTAGKTCKRCRKARKGFHEQRSAMCVAAGLCYECPSGREKKAITSGKRPVCLECWFKTIAKNNTGDREKWTVLNRLWEEQSGRCAYTGRRLQPGVNASIDHKTPVSRGGGNEESNLHWVEFRVNTMKYDQTHEEFVETCRLITARFA